MNVYTYLLAIYLPHLSTWCSNNAAVVKQFMVTTVVFKTVFFCLMSPLQYCHFRRSAKKRLISDTAIQLCQYQLICQSWYWHPPLDPSPIQVYIGLIGCLVFLLRFPVDLRQRRKLVSQPIHPSRQLSVNCQARNQSTLAVNTQLSGTWLGETKGESAASAFSPLMMRQAPPSGPSESQLQVFSLCHLWI